MINLVKALSHEPAMQLSIAAGVAVGMSIVLYDERRKLKNELKIKDAIIETQKAHIATNEETMRSMARDYMRGKKV